MKINLQSPVISHSGRRDSLRKVEENSPKPSTRQLLKLKRNVIVKIDTQERETKVETYNFLLLL